MIIRGTPAKSTPELIEELQHMVDLHPGCVWALAMREAVERLREMQELEEHPST